MKDARGNQGVTTKTLASDIEHRATKPNEVARLIVGLIWLARATWNLLVTLWMADPYGWLAEESPFRVYRWFFAELVGAYPAAWTLLLIASEVTLGVLTLSRGGWARIGLGGGILFSMFLFGSGTPYTMLMGAYALLLFWLARYDYPQSPVDHLQSPGMRHDTNRASGQ